MFTVEHARLCDIKGCHCVLLELELRCSSVNAQIRHANIEKNWMHSQASFTMNSLREIECLDYERRGPKEREL